MVYYIVVISGVILAGVLYGHKQVKRKNLKKRREAEKRFAYLDFLREEIHRTEGLQMADYAWVIYHFYRDEDSYTLYREGKAFRVKESIEEYVECCSSHWREYCKALEEESMESMKGMNERFSGEMELLDWPDILEKYHSSSGGSQDEVRYLIYFREAGLL